MKDRYTLPVLLLVFVVLAAGIVAAGGLPYRSQQDSCRTLASARRASDLEFAVNGGPGRSPRPSPPPKACC